MTGLFAQWGVFGGIAAALLLLARLALVAAISLWSLKADEEGRRHALELLRMIKVDLPGRRRAP